MSDSKTPLNPIRAVRSEAVRRRAGYRRRARTHARGDGVLLAAMEGIAIGVHWRQAQNT